MFLVNSRLGHFSAAFPSKWVRPPFSRSYGVILPSSLTTLLPIILGFSPRLPVSVYGTGTSKLDRSFSRQCEIRYFPTYFRSPSRLIVYRSTHFTMLPYLTLGRSLPFERLAYPAVSLLLSNAYRWYWNFNQLSIAYASRPQLRSRLTLSGRTFLRKP